MASAVCVMWGLAGAQLFGLLAIIAITSGVTITHAVEQWARVLTEREKTKRTEMKSAARRAKAEARTVAGWTAPVSTPDEDRIKYASIVDALQAE